MTYLSYQIRFDVTQIFSNHDFIKNFDIFRQICNFINPLDSTFSNIKLSKTLRCLESLKLNLSDFDSERWCKHLHNVTE